MQIFRNAESYMVNILGLEMEDKGGGMRFRFR